MKSEATGDLKKAIIEVLKEKHNEVSLSYLLDRLKKKGLEEDEVAVKAAIWQLIADAAIELTPVRKLRLHDDDPANAAVAF